MHLAQVVSFVSLCATRTWKNWKLPSVLKTVSYRVRRGRITISPVRQASRVWVKGYGGAPGHQSKEALGCWGRP